MGFAVRALGDIGDGTAIPALIAALRYTVTRSESSTALTRFGPWRFRSPRDREERARRKYCVLRERSSQSIGMEGGTPVSDRPDIRGSRDAARACCLSPDSTMPKESLETLISELVHEEDWRRMRATAACLAGGPKAVEGLIHALEAGSPALKIERPGCWRG